MEVRPVKQNIIKEQERNRHQFYPVNTEAAAEEKHICATDKPPTQSKPVSALQERQVADIRTKPVQRQGARLEQLVTSPLQQERIQPVQNLPALSPARQQAVQDSWHRAAQPLYQALRPQLEALQQIQDPALRRMTEAALERPFCLLWQEAVRRQTGPVVEELLQQDGGNPSRLLAEAATGRFYDLLWEEMKGRSAKRSGMPGIALLESGVMPRDADGDAEEIAKIDKPYPKAAEAFDSTWKSGMIERATTIHASERMREREVTDDDVRDARTNPIHSKGIVIDDLGRKSQILIGKNATVCLNPDTGKIITVWKTGTKTRKKYEGGD